MIRDPRRSTCFPHSPLSRCEIVEAGPAPEPDKTPAFSTPAPSVPFIPAPAPPAVSVPAPSTPAVAPPASGPRPLAPAQYQADLDRKSTRLNSSHANISYAVF